MTPPPAHILALVPYRLGTAGGQRTTIECWEPVLEAAGITLRFAPFESEALHRDLYQAGRVISKSAEVGRAYVRRLCLFGDLSAYDAVFVYREAALIGPELLERWVVRRGIPLLYGLDDPLFVPYRSPANGRFSRLKFPGKVARLCSMADAVIVNGSPLRDFALGHNDNVWVVPNLVDETFYRPLPRPASARPLLGWIGSPTTMANLDILAEPLSRLAQRRSFDLDVVGARRESVGDVACTSRPWTAATEVADLRRFDIGLLPLSEHPWNAWKFNYKLAQYMALGIPPVCSPAGSNAELVDHGVTGFLATDTAGWIDCIETLIVDEGRRQQMGEAAATFAQERFTRAANADTIVAAFHSVLGRPQARAALGRDTKP